MKKTHDNVCRECNGKMGKQNVRALELFQQKSNATLYKQATYKKDIIKQCCKR